MAALATATRDSEKQEKQMIVNLIRNDVEEQIISNSELRVLQFAINWLRDDKPISFPEDATADLKLVFFLEKDALVDLPYFLEIKADCKNERISAYFKFVLEDVRESDDQIILTYRA